MAQLKNDVSQLKEEHLDNSLHSKNVSILNKDDSTLVIVSGSKGFSYD